MEKATRKSWNNRPMPPGRASLAFHRTFAPEEFERMGCGLIPEAMEDKWFIFLEDDHIFFHRSWTGCCIYQIHFRERGGGYEVDGAWVNRDPAEYASRDDEYDAALLAYLVDRLLLGKSVPFPSSGTASPAGATLHMHHVVGHAKPNRPGDENMKTYARALATAIQDGGIDPSEEAFLAALRDSLGVTQEQHEALLRRKGNGQSRE